MPLALGPNNGIGPAGRVTPTGLGGGGGSLCLMGPNPGFIGGGGILGGKPGGGSLPPNLGGGGGGRIPIGGTLRPNNGPRFNGLILTEGD